MNRRHRILTAVACASMMITRAVGASDATAAPASQPAGSVVAPSDAVFEGYRAEDREAARAFYKKSLAIGGLTILAAESVDDAALVRTREIVSHLLAGRPDVLTKMQQVGTHLIVIGKDQVYTDMPEYRRSRNPAFQNERVRGTGGLEVTSFGEENLLNLPIDRYDDESIAVHEFCHTIDAALVEVDPTWRQRLRSTFQNALSKGRWKGAYASSNPAEYWAEIAQSYFDCNRINNWNHTNVATREQLKQYDPEGYELVRTTFNLSPQADWRYTPVQKQPSVIAPPARFKVDPCFTKFTYAREFPIIASAGVSDEALLRANTIVRKLFAYRHDVLKSLINDDVRLVVLARGERLSDLPQLKSWATSQPSGWDEARYLDYVPSRKVMVVPEENLLGDADDGLDGASAVVRVMARAMFIQTARRPFDPEWDQRPPQVWQQYELRLTRLDEPPVGTPRPITTREALRYYDPDLYDLVDQTFAYSERVDWRYTSPRTTEGK